MTHEQIKEIVKNDLREHPEKRNNIQFCVSCSAYGVDLDEVDAELSQGQPKTIEQCQTSIDTREECDKLTQKC